MLTFEFEINHRIIPVQVLSSAMLITHGTGPGDIANAVDTSSVTSCGNSKPGNVFTLFVSTSVSTYQYVGYVNLLQNGNYGTNQSELGIAERAIKGAAGFRY